MNNRETFITQLRAAGFKLQLGHCEAAKVLIYKTGFWLTGNYRQQVLSGLHDLLRLVEADIEKVENMNYLD